MFEKVFDSILMNMLLETMVGLFFGRVEESVVF